MKIETHYVTALGIPTALVLALVSGYYLLVFAGLDEELALDSATIAVTICALAVLRGIHEAPQRTWSLEFAGLLTMIIAIAALATRSISLASSPGPLFFFTIASSVVLGFIALRILRNLNRRMSGGTGARTEGP
jgi:hypothetical protein